MLDDKNILTINLEIQIKGVNFFLSNNDTNFKFNNEILNLHTIDNIFLQYFTLRKKKSKRFRKLNFMKYKVKQHLIFLQTNFNAIQKALNFLIGVFIYFNSHIFVNNDAKNFFIHNFIYFGLLNLNHSFQDCNVINSELMSKIDIIEEIALRKLLFFSPYNYI